ncbi:MAG: glycoside hydrolase family 3 C-terminal domain-containing protein [Propionibacteriaceae bacterium]|jgi:beta-glucosidase|nr:glycoside hydrolase family 3 C-terminal domain-containing protein [Propionibacteriaceae bacterium]
MPDFTDFPSLTLAEKASLLSGDGPWHTHAIPAIGLPRVEVADGPHGLRVETGVDLVWIPSTCFPTASALGASWDCELAARVGRAIGAEAKALGVQAVLGPGVNMKRTPLCGRNFEYFSEDPVHTAGLAAAWIDGLQSTGIAACLKHFAANNQETNRTEVSAEADEATLRELYLEVFRQVIEMAQPWSVMCSYNLVNGVRASQNRWLLTQVLRDDWGYRGLVISDWDAVRDPVESCRAGLDLEMPGTDGRSAAAIAAAVLAGTLGEETVDRAAKRVAAFANRVLPAGRAPNPIRDLGITPGGPLSAEQLELLHADEHHQLAREAAAGSAVLLRNENGILPLAAANGQPASGGQRIACGQRIAVIGGFAQIPRIQGGGSSGVSPTRVDIPLDEIIAIAGDRVSYAPGYPLGQTNFYTESEPPDQDAGRLLAEAVSAGAQADVVVAFVGLRIQDETEARDRVDLALPPEQIALLESLARLGKPLVVVLAAGAPVVLDDSWHDASAAILLTHLGGQGVGGAVADILFGRTNPSGKLAETWPLRLADTPGIDTFPGTGLSVHYAECTQIGYRWYDAQHLPVRYRFGHGLSYTTFSYSDLSIAQATPECGTATDAPLPNCGSGQLLARPMCAEFTLTNTGDRPGAEVVQCYVAPADAARPATLAGFTKVWLAPGEQRHLRCNVPAQALAHWEAGRGWATTPGPWIISVGASSSAIRLTTEFEPRKTL